MHAPGGATSGRATGAPRTSFRLFAVIHYLTVLAWFPLVVGAILTTNGLSTHLDNRVLHAVIPPLVLPATVLLGIWAQVRLFA